MTVQFFGAAQTTTGSMHLVEANGLKILVAGGNLAVAAIADLHGFVKFLSRVVEYEQVEAFNGEFIFFDN